MISFGLQTQNNARMAEAQAAMKVVRHAAERGAEQGVRWTQLMQKFSAHGTAAVGAVQGCEVRSVERRWSWGAGEKHEER